MTGVLTTLRLLTDVLLCVQVVVLCRTFQDSKPAEAACHGIKLLTTLLQKSRENATRVFVANYVAGLSHTRPGLQLLLLLQLLQQQQLQQHSVLFSPAQYHSQQRAVQSHLLCSRHVLFCDTVQCVSSR